MLALIMLTKPTPTSIIMSLHGRTPVLISISAWSFRTAYLTLDAAAARWRVADYAPALLSRYVSCLHAGALVALGLLWRNGMADRLWWIPAARAVPIGYLIHDTHLIWTEPDIWELSTFVHHVSFALLVFFAPAAFPDLTARAFLAEISVFPLNLGWVMLKTGASLRWPRVFAINSMLLLLTFLRFRVYAFTVITFEVMRLNVWPLVPLIAGLTGLNWYWFALLCGKARSLLRR
jgi:hypothetical protein